MKKTILIISRQQDVHVDIIIDKLYKLNCNVFRLNTEDFTSNFSLTLKNNINNELCGTITNLSTNKSIKINDIWRAWYRKPEDFNISKSIQNIEAINFIKKESQQALHFLYNFPGLKWLNHPDDIRKAERKYLQLQVAKKNGLSIPSTIITNDEVEAKKFFNSYPSLICKVLHSIIVTENEPYYSSYTHKIDKSNFYDFLNNINLCPVLFQEYIDKKYEIRSTVVNGKVFSCKIDSQSSEESKIDFRLASNISEIPHESIQLPKYIDDALISITTYFGLKYSAIDLIFNKNNEYVFLEINPNGQWYWIEMLTDMKIADEVISTLLLE